MLLRPRALRLISDREQSASPEGAWGAIAFTADGSYSSTWKMPSQLRALIGIAALHRRALWLTVYTLNSFA